MRRRVMVMMLDGFVSSHSRAVLFWPVVCIVLWGDGCRLFRLVLRPEYGLKMVYPGGLFLPDFEGATGLRQSSVPIGPARIVTE